VAAIVLVNAAVAVPSILVAVEALAVLAAAVAGAGGTMS
jgi:hypothetical protein